jgi:hypothetical protein
MIGTTRTRALCSAMHRVIAPPAVAAAMGSDKTYAGFRTSLRDYLITATSSSRDMKITVMDRTVQSMVKSVDKLETALNSGRLGTAGERCRWRIRLHSPTSTKAWPACLRRRRYSSTR